MSNIGYGRVELANAAAAQMVELSYCQSFFKTTHPAAIRLAEKLTSLLPEQPQPRLLPVVGLGGERDRDPRGAPLLGARRPARNAV